MELEELERKAGRLEDIGYSALRKGAYEDAEKNILNAEAELGGGSAPRKSIGREP
jgi:hypothetical protein